MATEIKDAKDGLKTRIETISGLRVLDHIPNDVNEFPMAHIQFTGRTSSDSLDGVSFMGTITLTVYIRMSNELEAMDELDKYMETTGTESIEAAMDADQSWESKVAIGQLLGIVNVRRFQTDQGAWLHAADFMCQFRTAA